MNALEFNLQGDGFHLVLLGARLALLRADVSLARARRLLERPDGELVYLRQRVAELERRLDGGSHRVFSGHEAVVGSFVRA